MIINKDVISQFSPCKERFDNYLNHYSDFSSSFDDFIDLPNISYEDKIWVAKRVLNKNQLVHFGIMCAESVLHIFEEKYPEDKRVRECLEFVKSFPDYSNLTQSEKDQILQHRNQARSAADAAAYAAYASAAYAADAAAYASAAYASAAYAADAAADYASARQKQQILNLQLLKMAASL